MKKIMKSILMIAVLALGAISCDIETSRPLTAKVTVVLKDIPADVGAVAIFCNLNEWKADNVNGSTEYIAPVKPNGTATWTFKDYTLATPLKFQFTPMPSADTKLGDNWWSFALSGSSTYANEENNLYCDFIGKNKHSNCTITMTKASFLGADSKAKWNPFPLYGVRSTRQFNEGFRKAFTVE